MSVRKVGLRLCLARASVMRRFAAVGLTIIAIAYPVCSHLAHAAELFINTNSPSTFDGVDYGAVAWGDFDNDGDLDLAVSGNRGGGVYDPQTFLYRNIGNGAFTNFPAGLPGVRQSTLAWGD
jgi:hypothetical protein